MNGKKAGILFLIIVLVDFALMFGVQVFYAYWPQYYSAPGAMVLSESVLLVPALIMAAFTPGDLKEQFPFREITWRAVVLSVPIMFCILPVIAVCNLFTMQFVPNTVDMASNYILQWPVWVMVPIMGIYGPLCEEMVFRGYIYQSFRRSAGVMASALMSALLFGLIHLNLNQACYAFVIGIFFALAAEATGSITMPFIMHALFNTTEVLLMYYTSSATEITTDGSTVSYSISGMAFALYGTMAAVGILVAVILLHRVAKFEGRSLREMPPVHRVGRMGSVALIISIAICVLYIGGNTIGLL